MPILYLFDWQSYMIDPGEQVSAFGTTVVRFLGARTGRSGKYSPDESVERLLIKKEDHDRNDNGGGQDDKDIQIIPAAEIFLDMGLPQVIDKGKMQQIKSIGAAAEQLHKSG